MKPHFAIRRLLAILMIAGLALAPVSRPVMATTSSQASHEMMADEMTSPEMSSSEMSADTMDEMASDMPCCPSKAPMPVGCDECVFMAACGSIGFPALSATIAHPFPILSDTIALQRNDAWPDGLGHPPPDHPPRRLV
ncbi:hypothetical protein [Bradyrhizobium erythrophlei]|uniref:hypothetical protein n=1 Tax=Bradyrhizobium erythrophlei TaxID=1437360 RepID=UPI0009A584BD|nr:hypothetical protein [Bradyrhizobium erythrophlei]